MNERERILRKVVEKYKNDIIFHVSSDECMIEFFEPWTVWIQPLGYEIIEDEAECYVEVLLKSPKDTNEPRVGTYAEKYLEVSWDYVKNIVPKKLWEALMKRRS